MTSSTTRPPNSQPEQSIADTSAVAAANTAANAGGAQIKHTIPHSHIKGHGHGHATKPPVSKSRPAARPAITSETGAVPNHRPVRGKAAKKNHPLVNYAKLMRLDKPIGILLLLWPTLWALWLAAKGIPRIDLLVIFTLGVIVMRSAGCVINDFADRKIDGQVYRTQDRPLATGAVSSTEAIVLFIVLCLMAFGLVLMTDMFTVKLSLVGVLLAFIYPFMKRYTHLPQVVLGAAFAWSVPMAFAAQSGKLTPEAGMLYLAVVLWTVVYDTFYAMVDRDDDVKIGVKSTAVLFGEQDRFITGALQIMTLLALLMLAPRFGLGLYYYLCLGLVALLFYYQQTLISDARPGECFKAFLNNNWVGFIVFAGISIDFAMK